MGDASTRPWLLLAAALLVVIDGLLIRIAAGAGFTDWAHTYSEEPRLFIAILVVAVIDLGVGALMLWRPRRAVLLATVAWGALVAVFGVVLLVFGNDTSGSAISIAALIAAWLAHRATRTTARGR